MRFKWLLVSGLFGVGLLLLLFLSTSLSFTYNFATNETDVKISNALVAQVGAALPDTKTEFWPRMWQQVDGVLAFTAQIIDAVGDGPGQLFQVASNDPPATPEEVVNFDPTINANNALRGVPAPSVYGGTLIANVPLEVTDRLTVRGPAQFGDLAVTGAFTINDLEVPGVGTIGSLVAGGSRVSSLAVSGNTELNTLSVSGPVNFTTLTAGTLTVNNALTARGGVNTQGANVDLSGGNIFAANIINTLTEGDNISISGTANNPIISADVPSLGSRVRSLNGVRGTLTLVGGDDVSVTVSGTDITLANTSDLGSVAGRGGCTDCLLDADVIDALTIASGTIDGTVIGSTTPAEATFTTVTITDTATSTFGGPINVTSGCVAVNGVCLGIGVTYLGDLLDVSLSGLASDHILRYDGSDWVNVDLASLGIGDGTYLGLTDTPSAYVTGAVPFVNATGSAMTQSTSLTFDGSQLAIGSTTPVTTLTVAGDMSLLGQQATRYYDLANSNYVGFRASTTLSGTTVWTLPEADGTSDQFIVTDGAGNLRFADLSGLGAVSALDDLSDVSLSSPALGDVLVYDGSNWVDRATSTLGLGDGSFTGLSDAPASLIADAILFADASGTNITQSANFIFDGTQMAVGAAAAVTTLTVGGDVSLLNRQALRLYETGSGNYVGFRASTTLSTDTTWTLPTGDGLSDQVLVTDGLGNLRFESVSAVGGGASYFVDLADVTGPLLNKGIPYVATDTLAFSSELVFDGGTGRLGVGTDAPTDELTVYGSVYFGQDVSNPGLVYEDADDELGIGTAAPAERLNVENGSVLQRGGRSGSAYYTAPVASLNISDTAYDVYVVGTRAYVVTGPSGNDFHIVDITDREAPVELGSLSLPDTANAVYVSGNYAYVVTDVTGDDFHIIDISDAAAPVEVGSVNLLSSSYDVVVQGRYAYVTGDNTAEDFVVIDVADPTAPVQVGSENLTADVNGVAVRGQYAYVVTDATVNGFAAIDISDPTNPTVVGTLSMPDATNDVIVRGDYAYVVSDPIGDDFHVVDISDPTGPTLFSSLNLATGANAVAVSGSYAYVATAGTGNDIRVIDITDLSAPVEVGGADLASGAGLGVSVRGRYAYVTTSTSGDEFFVIDLTGVEAQTVLAHSLESGSLSVLGNMIAAGNVSLESGLRVGASGIQTEGDLLVQGSGTSIISGELALGTTTASYQLAVAGDAFIGGQLYGSNYTAGTYGQILMANGVGQVWTATSTLGLSSAFTTSAQLASLLSNETGSGSAVFSNSPTFSGTALFSNATFDQVGVGTTSPAYTFDVYGNARIDGTLIVDSCTGCGGGGVAFPFTPTTNFGVTVNSTTTPLWLRAGLMASSTAYLTDANVFGTIRFSTTTGSTLVTVNNTSFLTSTTSSVGLGSGTLTSLTSGSENTFIGDFAGAALQQASEVTAVGQGALSSATYSEGDVAIGVGALLDFSGSPFAQYNTFVGSYSGENLTFGNYMVGIGASALGGRESATNTVAIGAYAGHGDSGDQSQNNVFVGAYAGTQNTTGSNNIAIGYQAGDALTSGSNNIIIGYDVEAPSNSGSNQLNIGNFIFGTGIDGTGTTISSGLIGIGTTTPGSTLTVEGTILASNLFGGSTGLSTDAQGNIIRDPSDARLKTNVQPLEDALSKVLALQGVSYQWIDSSRFGAQTEIGFVAQEVDLILPEVVRKGGEYWSLNTQNILAVVVEAIKEMWIAIGGNQERITELEGRVEYLESLLDAKPVPASVHESETASPSTEEDGFDRTDATEEAEASDGTDTEDEVPASGGAEVLDVSDDTVGEGDVNDNDEVASGDDNQDAESEVTTMETGQNDQSVAEEF